MWILSWNHCTLTPHRSKTKGTAEGAVRRIQEGTSAVLLQSGLDEKWWSDSMECRCYLPNVQDLLSDGKTLFERRFGVPFNGPVPFGAMVEYHPIPASIWSWTFNEIYSLDMRYTRGESGKETFWSRTLRIQNRWTHLKSMQKASMQRKYWHANEWWKIEKQL